MSNSLAAILNYYRQHLGKYFIFRLVRALLTQAYSCTRLAYFVLCKPSLLHKAGLISLREYKQHYYLTSITVLPSQFVAIPEPRCFASKLAEHGLHNPAIQLVVPQLEITYITHGQALAGSYLTLVNGFALHPDIFNPATDRSPLETFGIARIFRQRKYIFLMLDQPAIKVKSAINLLGQNAGNYAHWLTEILPKLVIANKYEAFKDQALLVDGWIHANLHESINWLRGNEKPVIYVNRWQAVEADQLIDISLPGYEPYIPHELLAKERPIYVNSFSRYALDLLRKECHMLARCESLPTGTKYIYLKRSAKSSNVRRVVNIDELELILAEHGFQFIEAETLSFKQQVSACLNAEIIVGPVGAALANIIFAPKGCKVLALAPYYSSGNYYYYSNLAAALGHELGYILGLPQNNGNHPMHQDYYIDNSEFAAAIKLSLSTSSRSY